MNEVNIAPAQTWNFLNINSAKIELNDPNTMTQEIDIPENSVKRLYFISDDINKDSMHNVKINVGAGAKVEVNIIVIKGNKQHRDAFSADLAEKSTLELHEYLFSASFNCAEIKANLSGDNSTFYADMRYIGKGDQKIDINYDVMQSGKQTKSNINVYGVLSGRAKKTMRAAIDLVKGCKKSTGTENETVVISGDDVMCKTLPVILCAEEDVEGNHGATIGSLSHSQLFYLDSRGLSESDTVELMEDAFLDDAMNRVPANCCKALQKREM